MVIHQLTPEQCFDVLRNASYGRLACARSDQPYVVPFFFSLDAPRDCLYSFSTVGQRVDWMRDNPKVCVEIDHVIDQFNWTTVVAFGRYREITTSPQDEGERRRASEMFQKRDKWWLPALGSRRPDEEHPTSVIYRIDLEKLTGRRAAGRVPVIQRDT
jgi:nitroimidazol reductase NimA-like FMN-containing flavoprotein (pyridoxamine 5'-phosphate oxidase superfamily)